MTEPAEHVVGPVVGPVAHSTQTATPRYVPSDAAYNIAIGGLPFQKAPSDEHPYARETADFKRQQIDQAATPGDQSLTGFWTRGQLSFHQGAGIRFYELSDGETVLNRFTDSLGVDPWTPGQVTLRAPAEQINSTGTQDALLHDGGIARMTPAGGVALLTYAGSATALPLTGGGAATSITSDGVNLYATNGDKIDKREPGGSFATLFTHPTPKDWTHVWWAKDRLWMMDEDGGLYVEAPSGTLAAGDLLWSAGLSGVSWSLTDSEGAVFLAGMDTVWASTIDASTATPVVGAPVVVARVGAQETIGAIGAYLGYLTVASSAGIRVGLIRGEGLLLGDLVVECDASDASRMAFRRSLVATSGVDDAGDTVVYELDLLEQISDLQPAFAPVRNLGVTSGGHGTIVLPDGRCGFFGEDGVFLEDTALGDASGTIQTGFHRFGTLELKDFRTVSVFAEGTAGTVGVSLVRRDGTATSLVTLGAEHFAENELALHTDLSGPTDYVGLLFTLTADSGEAPTLLGYQLRALPAPKRHRLIQVPLLCMDEEVVGNTKHGYKGWARDRLFELEEMELEAGAVLYQDFDLDETGTVLIEKVQFQNVTPPRADGNGFGGILMVTMRKVA